MDEKSNLSISTNEQACQEQNQKPPKKRRALFAVLCIATAVVFFVGGALTVWFSLDSQMRSLVRLKRKIDKEYYYTVDDDAFYGAMFGAVNTQIFDNYSEYLTAEEYAQMQLEGQGNRAGLGLVLSTAETDEMPLRIVRVCGNSPAEKAGIVAGEYITGVGKSADTVVPVTNFSQFSALLGEIAENTDLYLTLKNGSSVRTVCLQKQEYVENYVFYRTKDVAYRFTGNTAQEKEQYNAPLDSLPENAAYIRLTQFNGGATEQFAAAMSLFKEQNKQTLVLDLRQNGGGYMHILMEIAAYFCKQGGDTPTVAIADYGESKEYYQASKNLYDTYFSVDSHIYVLADDGTASASEALMGCMLDYVAIDFANICLVEKNGVAKTYGKGIMQTTFPLTAGKTDAVKLTTARIVWPKTNTCIHDVGITKANGTKTVAANIIDAAELQAALTVIFG